MAIVSVFMWWTTRQLLITRALRAEGATLHYKFEYQNWEDLDSFAFAPPSDPPFLVKCFGPDVGSIVVRVNGIPESNPTAVSHYSAKLPEVRMLAIQDCDLKDADLLPLLKLNKLRGLYLRGTAITDKSVETFRQMKNLEVLNIDYTNLSTEAVDELRTSLPETRVHFRLNDKSNRKTDF